MLYENVPERAIPETGDSVLYALTAGDAEQINQRRRDAREHFATHGAGRSGVRYHVGNVAHEGDVYAAVVVRCWGAYPDSAVNLQVFLDGTDTLWVTSVLQGEGVGHFLFRGLSV